MASMVSKYESISCIPFSLCVVRYDVFWVGIVSSLLVGHCLLNPPAEKKDKGSGTIFSTFSSICLQILIRKPYNHLYSVYLLYTPPWRVGPKHIHIHIWYKLYKTVIYMEWLEPYLRWVVERAIIMSDLNEPDLVFNSSQWVVI